jgi:hypothetical protein
VGTGHVRLPRAQPSPLHKQHGSHASGHDVHNPTFLFNDTNAVHLFAPAVTASVYQMMRGAEMLFAALFAVVFLRRRWGRGAGLACPFTLPTAWDPPTCASCSVLTRLLLTLLICMLAAA